MEFVGEELRAVPAEPGRARVVGHPRDATVGVSPTLRGMPEVLIAFSDGEVLHAATPELTFDLPIIEAELRTVDPNTEQALFPLTAVRLIVVGDVAPAPSESELQEWDRAVFHFMDGQALRVHIAPDALLGRHGGVWRTVEPGSDEMRTLAIPYAALKGIYQVRQWDSRPAAERRAAEDPDARLDQLARILAERDDLTRGDLSRPAKPLMERVRKGRRDRVQKETPS